MPTLEMVPLRSMYPNSGRVTLRNPTPRFNIDLSLDQPQPPTEHHQTTTPQVTRAEQAEGETAARKGGQAR